MSRKDLRRIRKKMQIIFQDPFASLNPRMSIGRIIGEPLRVHRVGTAKEQEERVKELMQVVGIPEEYSHRSRISFPEVNVSESGLLVP